MAIRVDGPSLRAFRQYLDETMYAAIDLRLSFEVGFSRTGYPNFGVLKEVVKRLDPVHRVLFQLFRLGEEVDDRTFRHAVPEGISTALTGTGLLRRTEDGGWRTPSLLVIPAEGLAVLVNVPPTYPTATAPTDCWFDLSSYVLAKSLPGSLAGQRVLDICSGSGFQSLICASRGATHAVGLELNANAVALAGANAALNGLADKVEFRQSDLLSSLADGERFDFVVCNTPHAPQIEGPDAPPSLERLGTHLVWHVLNDLPPHLSERSSGFVATWLSAGYQGSTYQTEALFSLLEREGCSVAAFLDQSPSTIEDVLRGVREDLSKRPAADLTRVDRAIEDIRHLLRDMGSPVDGFFNQLVYFRKGMNEPALRPRSVFGLQAMAPPAKG